MGYEIYRDPRTNPKAGDAVRGVWRNPKIHIGPAATLTVQARLGDLVATSSTGGSEIRWQLLSTWCQEDGWLSGWEVLHVAKDL
jgi:hypothetical protein